MGTNDTNSGSEKTAEEIVRVSSIDGVHLDTEANIILGQAIAEKVKLLLSNISP